MALWIPLSDESLPLESLDEKALARLETLWRKALQALGFAPTAAEPFFRRGEKGVEQNLTQLVAVLGEGALRALHKPDGTAHGAYEIVAERKLRGFSALVKLQWKLERYLANAGAPHADPLPDLEARRVRSLALGLCQQALLLRLPRHRPEELAAWLREPDRAARGLRRTIRLLLALQKERDSLANSWRDFVTEAAPPPPAAPLASAQPESRTGPWPALLVSQGVDCDVFEGFYWIAPDTLSGCEEIPSHASILIFPKARPEAVAHFSRARAVLFVEGGLLSHACSIARERRLTCFTGLKTGFLRALRERRPARLRISVSSAAVEFIP